MNILVQAACLAAIILVAYLAYKKYPKKFTVKAVILIALLAVLKQALTLLSLTIPLFGVPSLRIGISQLPLMIGGVLLGPLAAVVLGLVSDIVGLLVTPTAYPFLGFTLGSILCALLPALVMERFSKVKNPTGLLWLLLVAVWLLNLVTVITAPSLKLSAEVSIELNFLNSLLVMSTITILLAVIVIIYRFVTDKIRNDNFIYELWFIGVVLVELTVNIILTPYWLQVMYGIPFFASSTLRIFKATLMINVESAIGYFVLLVCRKLLKEADN